MNNSAFESWYNGMVGFHINSERILDDIAADPLQLKKWFVVCWNNAIDACVESSDYVNFDVDQLKEKI